MIKNKKGMSAIVTTIIIIGIALAAVGVVWYVISNVVGTQQTKTETVASNLGKTCTTTSPATYEITTVKPNCAGITTYTGGQKCCSIPST